MGNQWCHVCGGLVDRIGLQPAGVRLCGCTRKLVADRARIEELEQSLWSRDMDVQAKDIMLQELVGERDRLRQELHLSEQRCRNYEDVLKAADMNAALTGRSGDEQVRRAG